MSTILGLLLGLALLAIGILAVRDRRARAALEDRQDEVRRLETTVRHLQVGQERFFDQVTHELRSPLAAILGYQELLADGVYGGLDEGAAGSVERIGRSARHLFNLVEGLIELTRLQTGTLRPDIEPLDLGVLVSSVVEAFRTQLHERGLSATVDLADSLPVVRTDRDRLLRVFDLLITSAVKHPAGDSLDLSVSRLPDGAALRIAGTSIQIRPDASDPAARLGIRLAIADATAEFLAGDLALETDQDGLVHAFRLRVRSVPEPAEPDRSAAGATRPGAGE